MNKDFTQMWRYTNSVVFKVKDSLPLKHTFYKTSLKHKAEAFKSNVLKIMKSLN